MSAQFPRVPRVRGDTDDEASIHLYGEIGPAKPLRTQLFPPKSGLNRQFDQSNHILKILQENEEPSPEFDSFNEGFRKFAEDVSDEDYVDDGSDYSDSDVTVHEEDEDEEIIEEPNEKSNKTTEKPAKVSLPSSQSTHSKEPILHPLLRPLFQAEPKSYTPLVLLLTTIVSFVITIVFLLTFIFPRDQPPVGSSNSVSNRALDKVVSDITNKITVNSAQINSLVLTLDSRFAAVNAKLDLFVEREKVALLESQLESVKTKINNFEVLTLEDLDLEPKLNDISDKLNKLSAISENIDSVRASIVSDLIDSLPKHVPVYVKDGKVHYLPEFQKYLYDFFDNYSKKSYNWDSFIEANGDHLRSYVSGLKTNLTTINRSAVERFVNEKLEETNQAIITKFNLLVDKLDVSNALATLSPNQVLLESMLDIFSKGSIDVNYADHKLGARVLGFLTTTGHLNQKSWSRKLFLGWYDYLSSNGLNSPKNWKYNANNVLIDGGQAWECDTTKCSLGLRLFNAVVLTDVVIKSPDSNGPTKLSIYIKPKHAHQAAKVYDYLKQKVAFSSPSPNKYLTKFIKVQEVDLKHQGVNYIKLPVSLVNLKVPARDVYFEFEGPTPVSVYNLKVYGITELNSFKYDEEFDQLLTHAQHQEEDDDVVYELL